MSYFSSLWKGNQAPFDDRQKLAGMEADITNPVLLLGENWQNTIIKGKLESDGIEYPIAAVWWKESQRL